MTRERYIHLSRDTLPEGSSIYAPHSSYNGHLTFYSLLSLPCCSGRRSILIENYQLSPAMQFSSKLTLALLASSAALTQAENSTYYNPVLPGWHSDPSCIHVNGTFYCVTSTFISFPGLPIYASKDLINWKHVSHVWNRESQLPGYEAGLTVGQQRGMYAAAPSASAMVHST